MKTTVPFSVLVFLVAFPAVPPTFAAGAPMQQVMQDALTFSLPEGWVKSPNTLPKGFRFDSPAKTDYQGVSVGPSVVITKAPAGEATLPQLKTEFDALLQSSAAKVTAFLHRQNTPQNADLADIDKYRSSIQTINGREWILAEGVTVVDDAGIMIPMKSLAKVTLVDGVLYSAYVAAPLPMFESQKQLLQAIYSSIAVK